MKKSRRAARQIGNVGRRVDVLIPHAGAQLGLEQSGRVGLEWAMPAQPGSREDASIHQVPEDALIIYKVKYKGVGKDMRKGRIKRHHSHHFQLGNVLIFKVKEPLEP